MWSQRAKNLPVGLNHASIVQTLSSRAREYLAIVKHGLEQQNEPMVAPQTPLDVIVVGAGICGLSTAVALSQTGHNVTVFEAEPAISAIGAGIQLAPNATRQLWRWGLGKYLEEVCVHPRHLITRRWNDGNPVGMFKTRGLLKKVGSPFIQVHRGDLNTGLCGLAMNQGVSFRPNSKIVEYNHGSGAVTTASGETFSADLIVAADGVRSLARRDIDGRQPKQDALWVAYRANLTTDSIQRHSDIAWMVEDPHQNCWAGPDHHCQTYSMRANDLYNLVFIAPFSSSRDASEFKVELLGHFGHWDPKLAKLLSLVENNKVGKWPVWTAQHPEKWHCVDGKVTLLGDSAHDMTPFLGQGAAMAIEDAACLEILLTQIRPNGQKDADIASTLEIIQAFRSARTTKIRGQAEDNVKTWHLPDGDLQRLRDAAAAPEFDQAQPESTPYIFTDPKGQDWLYGYDVTKILSEG